MCSEQISATRIDQTDSKQTVQLHDIDDAMRETIDLFESGHEWYQVT